MVGSARIGESGLLELCDQHGWDTVTQFIDAWFSYSEQRMIREIRSLPSTRVHTSGGCMSSYVRTAYGGVLSLVFGDVHGVLGSATTRTLDREPHRRARADASSRRGSQAVLNASARLRIQQTFTRLDPPQGRVGAGAGWAGPGERSASAAQSAVRAPTGIGTETSVALGPGGEVLPARDRRGHAPVVEVLQAAQLNSGDGE